MRIEQLEMFVRTVDYHSMQRASEQLFTSIQNVSKSIKALEKELGVTLLSRGKNGVFPTEDGAKVYEHAYAITEHVHQLMLAYQKKIVPSTDEKRNVRLVSCASQSAILRPIMTKALQVYNNIKISYTVYEAGRIKEEILDPTGKAFNQANIVISTFGENDLAKIREVLPYWDVYYLRQDRVGIHCRRDDELARKTSVSMEELKELTLVDFADTSEGVSNIVAILNDQGYNLTPSVVTNLFTECTPLVESGTAYGLVAITEDDLITTKDTVVVPLEENICLYQMMFQRIDTSDSFVHTLRQYVLQCYPNTTKRFV